MPIQRLNQSKPLTPEKQQWAEDQAQLIADRKAARFAALSGGPKAVALLAEVKRLQTLLASHKEASTEKVKLQEAIKAVQLEIKQLSLKLVELQGKRAASLKVTRPANMSDVAFSIYNQYLKEFQQ